MDNSRVSYLKGYHDSYNKYKIQNRTKDNLLTLFKRARIKHLNSDDDYWGGVLRALDQEIYKRDFGTYKGYKKIITR